MRPGSTVSLCTLHFSLSFIFFRFFRFRNLPIPKSHFSITANSCLIRPLDRRKSSLRWRRPRFGRNLAWLASKICRSSKTGHRRVDSLRFATLAGFPLKALALWPFSLLLLVHSLGGCIRSARATRSEGLYFLPHYLSLVYGICLFYIILSVMELIGLCIWVSFFLRTVGLVWLRFSRVLDPEFLLGICWILLRLEIHALGCFEF